MFDLKRPCSTCPFGCGIGLSMRLPKDRLIEIFESPAFQCHNTVNYDEPILDDNGDEIDWDRGKNPQQCAGLIALLNKHGEANQITQLAERLLGFDPNGIEASDVYESKERAIEDHVQGMH